MKRRTPILLSAAATLLIGVVTVILARGETRRLAVAEAKREVLLRDASRLGGSAAKAAGVGDAMRSGTRNVKVIEYRVNHLMVLFRAVAGGSKFATELKWMALFQGLEDADAATLRQFLLRTFEEPGAGNEDALIVVAHALLQYVEKSPEESLELFGKASAVFKEPGLFQSLGEQVVATALGEWGARDPLAAAAWLRDNSESHKKYLTETARRGLVTAAASRDPRIAFHLLGEVGVSDQGLMVQKIMNGAAQAGEGDVAVTGLRVHLAALAADDRQSAEKSGMEGFARGLSSLGFSESEALLRKVGLEQRQLDQFAAGLRPEEKDNGSWLSWMGDHLSSAALEREAGKRVTRWAESDYQAAGDWLTGLPAGALREISTQAYAQAAAKYDPETAVQWAGTLPAGRRRGETLEAIHRDWPEDVPGKAAFAAANGLK